MKESLRPDAHPVFDKITLPPFIHNNLDAVLDDASDNFCGFLIIKVGWCFLHDNLNDTFIKRIHRIQSVNQVPKILHRFLF